MKQTTLSTLAVLFGNCVFGFSFIFSKMALELTTPFTLLSIRFFIAFLVVNLLVLTGRIKISLKGKPIKMLLLLGSVQPVSYFLCENYGMLLTSTTFSGVMLGTIPVMALILGRIILREKCTPFQIFCVVMSVVGVALTTTGGVTNISLLGTLLLLGAAVSAGLFTVISRKVPMEFDAFERTYVMLGLGCTVFTSISIVENWNNPAALLVPLSSPHFWIAAIFLAVVSSVIAVALVNYGVSRISLARAAILPNFATVISVLAGIFILKEEFEVLQIVGIVIITASVFGVSWPKREK